MKIIKSAAFLAGIVVVIMALRAQAQPTSGAPPELLLTSLGTLQDTVEIDIARLPKWQHVGDWMADGAAARSDPALAIWTSWAVSLRGRPVAARLDAINTRVNTAFRYASDVEIWGVRNYWATPSEVVAKGATDCTGFAIMKFWLARLAGLDDGDLTLLIGILPSTHQMHAVLLVGSSEMPVVLDSLHATIIDLGSFRNFRPLVAADLRGLHLFVRDLISRDDRTEVVEIPRCGVGRPKER